MVIPYGAVLENEALLGEKTNMTLFVWGGLLGFSWRLPGQFKDVTLRTKAEVKGLPTN